MLALSESRAAMYADEMDGGHEFQVHTLAEEWKAIADGWRVLLVSPLLPIPNAHLSGESGASRFCKTAPTRCWH